MMPDMKIVLNSGRLFYSELQGIEVHRPSLVRPTLITYAIVAGCNVPWTNAELATGGHVMSSARYQDGGAVVFRAFL